MNGIIFLETKYIPTTYKTHTIKPQGYSTVNPIENGVIDRILDINYYKTILKVDRKGRIILGRCNFYYKWEEKKTFFFSYKIINI